MRRASFSLKLNSLQNHGLTNLQNHGYNDIFVILPIGFGDFQNLCFPFGPPNLCFPSLYRKNVFYYCATFIRGHIRYQKEGILCALSIFSGDLSDIPIRLAPKSKPHALPLAVVYANCSVVSNLDRARIHTLLMQDHHCLMNLQRDSCHPLFMLFSQFNTTT